MEEIFNKSLFTSLIHLLEISQDVIDKKNYEEALLKLSLLRNCSNFSSFLYAYNYSLIKYIKKEDISQVKYLFQLFINEDFVIKNKFILYNNLSSYRKRILKEIYTFENYGTTSLSNISYLKFQKTKDIIIQGFKLLESVLPEWYQEINQFVKEVLILNAKNLRAGSSFDLFGLIYINYDYKTEFITDVVSFLIHESAHLYVFLLSVRNPLVLNSPEERYAPPLENDVLRVDKRPVIGIFHATFVLARIIYILKFLYNEGHIPAKEILYAKKMIKSYEERFSWGFNTLLTHGRLTEIGYELIMSTQKLVFYDSLKTN